MSRITDYGFLFQTTFGTSKTNLVNNIQLSQMNSSSVQKQLKAAGIDTNSKKYKAALSEMMKNGNSRMRMYYPTHYSHRLQLSSSNTVRHSRKC